ncbi:MAG: sulfite exporter TauE/SafE family protein [Burkholderiaceae bacterium]
MTHSLSLFILILCCLGACSGLLAGLLGIGGGMVLVPFLMFLLPWRGVPEAHVLHVAIGSSLGIILFTSLSSLRAHHRAGALLWPVVLRITPGILVGSLIGARLANSLRTAALAWAFGLFVIVSATQMLFDRKPKAARELPGAFGLASVGTVLGAVSSLVGAGGGFLSVPFMIWCNVGIRNAVATSAGIGLPIAVFSALGYGYNGWHVNGLPAGSLGFVYLPAVACVVALSIFTAPVGAQLAHRLPVATLKKIFAIVLYALALTMFYKAYTASDY